MPNTPTRARGPGRVLVPAGSGVLSATVMTT